MVPPMLTKTLRTALCTAAALRPGGTTTLQDALVLGAQIGINF